MHRRLRLALQFDTYGGSQMISFVKDLLSPFGIGKNALEKKERVNLGWGCLDF